MLRLMLVCGLTAVLSGSSPAGAQSREPSIRVAAGDSANASSDKQDDKLTPEQKMAQRFPQPARVGDLIGLPVLDWQDSTIGYIRQVIRKPDGKIQLVVPYGRWLGWVDAGGAFDRIRRPVAVPLEAVAILARQVAALDMSREDFDTAPAYDASGAVPLQPSETIRIAVTRR